MPVFSYIVSTQIWMDAPSRSCKYHVKFHFFTTDLLDTIVVKSGLICKPIYISDFGAISKYKLVRFKQKFNSPEKKQEKEQRYECDVK